mgnify:FL=1
MYRAEIIANRSVKEEIIEGLESALPGVRYTVIPDIEGRGKRDQKLGTVTWPELNFALFAYVADDAVAVMRKVIADLKERFPNEGIKLFFVEALE